MADTLYSEYIKQFGHPPENASYLQKFAKSKGQKIKYADASKTIKRMKASETQNPYVDNNLIEAAKKFQPLINEEFEQKYEIKNIPKNKKPQTLRARINYNNQTFEISIGAQVNKYTIASLRAEIIEKYISQPSSALIFKFNSVPVYNFKKDIREYAKDSTIVAFDVELWGANEHTLKSKGSVYEKIVKFEGINKKTMVDEIKKQFAKAYFTNDSQSNDEKTQSQYSRMGNWDKNLNEGITTVISAQQNELYNEVISVFDEKITETLKEHEPIQKEIQNNSANKISIQRQLDAMISQRKKKIEGEYQKKVSEMKANNVKMNHSWEQTQKATLQYYNGDNDVKLKIEKERVQRQKYQNRQINTRQTLHTLKKMEINQLHSDQKSKLLSTNNVQEWHNEFERKEIKKQKVNSLKKLVKNKIVSTKAQIGFAKYLHNSPFADSLVSEARKSDHEITKIAKLAQEPLFIDMVEISDKDEEKGSEEYLEFELRVDDDYENWDKTKQQNLMNDFAKLIGINVNDFEEISTREGSFIKRVKAKAKAIAKGLRDGIVRGGNVAVRGIDEMKQEVMDMSKKLYTSDSAIELTQALSYLKDKLGNNENNIDKETFYQTQQCVLVIVSNHKENKEEALLDGDFLNKSHSKELLKELMNPDWDREYAKGKTYWEGGYPDGKDRGPNPYYCPVGWKRYAFSHGTPAEYDQKFKGWSVCYHGTSNMAVGGILSHSIVTGWDTFFSPSIEYSAHPRYSTPRKMKDGKYVQMIFQCRIDPTVIHKWRQTLGVGRQKQIDKNFDLNSQHCQCGNGNGRECGVDGHNELEWWLQGKGEGKYDIVGLMIRISDDPEKLPVSDWWSVAGCKNHLNWKKA